MKLFIFILFALIAFSYAGPIDVLSGATAAGGTRGGLGGTGNRGPFAGIFGAATGAVASAGGAIVGKNCFIPLTYQQNLTYICVVIVKEKLPEKNFLCFRRSRWTIGWWSRWRRIWCSTRCSAWSRIRSRCSSCLKV